ncbi:MAG: ribosome biogenesis GTPase Der, partial [bacterium]
GLEGPFFISAKNGYGMMELLDRMVDFLRRKVPVLEPNEEEEETFVAIIGAPNTGKSSLVNRLLGTKRMVVSETPGTTRDAVDTVFNYQGEWVRLVDTAGLKKRRYRLEALDFYATIRALRAIERSDVSVLLLDLTRGITNGDLKLAQTAAQYGVGLVVAINKWDLISSTLNQQSQTSSLIETLQDMSAEIDRPLVEKATPDKIADLWQTLWSRRAPQLSWAPMLFVSALTGLHTDRLLQVALQVKKEREKLISTHQLNDELVPLLKKSPPPAVGGKISKIKYATQVGTAPPTFALFASYAHNIKEPYIRFSERLIRELYGFTGVPIRVQFRPK